ncbi:hypothetical protein [Caballeronia arvi]|nr:hypothetical protein [Caballeronia arvi]
MGNKLTERNARLRKQRVKWRHEVDLVEGYWKDCADEDRKDMRSELRHQLPVLEAEIEASNVDDFTKAELKTRLGALMREISEAPG